MTRCAACGTTLDEDTAADCPACLEPERYDDHQCEGLCGRCLNAELSA